MYIAAHEKKHIILDRRTLNRIIIGAYAEVTLHENVAACLSEESLEVHVHAHAQVTFIQESNEQPRTIIHQHKIILAEHAHFAWFALYKNVSGQVHMAFHMQGNQAHAGGHCLIMVEHADALAVHTRQVHEAPQARSSMN